MLLAGGQGSRLAPLTKTVAKPAVPFGGRYRIIDFTLSNCVNSGLDTVGVLTQYQPHVLNEYIGNGQPWDLDRMRGGVHVLPPYQHEGGGGFYEGTANAIYQNIGFIERFDPEYVVILSGDHIYKMNYAKMLAAHKRQNADCTIAVIEVPMEEASRFGIMNINPDGTIYEFEEKPAEPKSNLASMGIYIFGWEKLRSFLIADELNPSSHRDFGKDIIPAMLASGEKMLAYRFEGYWRDVGTIDTLWEANMDLLNPKVPLDLYEDDWKIYARSPVMPPHYIAPGAHVQHSIVGEGCTVEGNVDFSVLFSGVTVEAGATVRDSIVMPGSVIRSGALVQYAIVAENAVIGEQVAVGVRPEDCPDKDSWGVTVIADGVRIAPGCTIGAKQRIEADVGAGGVADGAR